MVKLTKKQLEEKVEKLEKELAWRMDIIKDLREVPEISYEDIVDCILGNGPIPPPDIICNCGGKGNGWHKREDKFFCSKCYN